MLFKLWAKIIVYALFIYYFALMLMPKGEHGYRMVDGKIERVEND